MGAEQKTHFRLDKSKCTKCGKCMDTCSGMVIAFGRDGYPEMKEFERFGWRGCWKCQHCLAVCPQGAISILSLIHIYPLCAGKHRTAERLG